MSQKDERGQQPLSLARSEELLPLLRERFEKNPHRHERILWAEVQAKLESNPAAPVYRGWPLAFSERAT
ncbi:MAG TPA: DUF4256 domain-containing protein [Longimicrobiaceae bacterium]|nr:DUF4256 domain-containing protein [Longimicrobiaceae bacterium]